MVDDPLDTRIGSGIQPVAGSHPRRPVLRLLLACPPRKADFAWGDYYFGHSLAESFSRAGFKVRISYSMSDPTKRKVDYLRRLAALNEVEIAMRGMPLVPLVPGKRRLLWLMSQPGKLDTSELKKFDHVFVASPGFREKIAHLCKRSSVLYQCTDARRFRPTRRKRSGKMLFVGNRRENVRRPVVRAAYDAGCAMEVWGNRWQGVIPDEIYAGKHIDNEELSDHYGGASVILNDHVDDMRAEGFLSNRVYDGLACATPVLSEAMSGMPEDLAPHIDTYADLPEVGPRYKEIMARGDSDLEDRLALAEHVRSAHSFDNRVATIAATISDLYTPRRRVVAAPQHSQ